MKTAYWIFTGLAAAFMIMSAIPDVMRYPPALTIFTRLGYPVYLLPFLGSLKIAGAMAILIPSFPGIREWAYAGLVFDLLGALYSHLQVGDDITVSLMSIIGLFLVFSSYLLHRSMANKKVIVR